MPAPSPENSSVLSPAEPIDHRCRHREYLGQPVGVCLNVRCPTIGALPQQLAAPIQRADPAPWRLEQGQIKGAREHRVLQDVAHGRSVGVTDEPYDFGDTA